MQIFFFAFQCLLLVMLKQMVFGQYTYKNTEILSRKKRYLLFPEDSNIVVMASVIKKLLIKVPSNFMTLIEIEARFKLPSEENRKKMKKYFYHTRHRREIYKQIAETMNMYGLDGKSCIKRAMCDVKELSHESNSLFQQLIVAVFSHEAFDSNVYCDDDIIKKCDFSLLDLLLYHVYKQYELLRENNK